MLHYTIPDFSDVNEFLSLLAKRQGKLKKGGMPNVDKAARGMLMDWNRSVLDDKMPSCNVDSIQHSAMCKPAILQVAVGAVHSNTMLLLVNISM